MKMMRNKERREFKALKIRISFGKPARKSTVENQISPKKGFKLTLPFSGKESILMISPYTLASLAI